MKLITPDSGYLSYEKIFKVVQAQKQRVVIWQIHESGHRTIYESELISYSADSKILYFQPPKEEIRKALPLYFYLEEQGVIFKSQMEEASTAHLTVGFPNEMRQVEEASKAGLYNSSHVSTKWMAKSSTERINDVILVKSMKDRTSRDQDFLNEEFGTVTLDQEDKLYADKRESKRVRPKDDKLVKLVRKGETKIHVTKLFDLSRGGMGFLTFTPDDFPKTSQVYVLGFDVHELDDPLVGTVMSQRPVDGSNIEYKIGVKFDEGQE